MAGIRLRRPRVRGVRLGDIPTGSIIQINEDGVPANYRVAQHDYIEAGVTAVERVLCLADTVAFNSATVNTYEGGDLDAFLTTIYRNRLDQEVGNALMTVNLPTTPGNGDYTATTIPRSLFVFSGTEFGFFSSYMPIEGSSVEIYTDDNASRIKYCDDAPATASIYWTRTVNTATAPAAWRVTTGGGGSSASVVNLHHLAPVLALSTTYRLPEYYPAKLEDWTWSQIAEISESGRATSFFRLGDEKTFTLSTGEEITMQIVGFGHDDLTDGGKAGITFGMKNLLAETYPMNSTNTNVGGWSSCQLRQTLRDDILPLFPSDLRQTIKNTTKKTTNGNQATSIVTYNQALWLYSAKEVGLQATVEGYMDEGETYPIFTDNASRIKPFSHGGAAPIYWLRSPYITNQTHFGVVSNTGAWSYAYATQGFGVCFGFCI